jgi:serine/threonine-protein kinase
MVYGPAMHPRVGSGIGIHVGDVIADKYRVDRILGVGGMGAVVAAHHLQLQELVAIKVLLPDALADADAVRRFEREARAAFKIKSEHVARIIDVGQLDSGAPFIVMEYLEGEDLAERIARTGPLAAEEAIEIVLQACEAIAEAHALGIVHRDIKPANLFSIRGADARLSIKVLDFGISKVTSSAPSSGLGMTKTRAVMGSPYYMSPEQMQSPRTVDARTDIWSLGVVLYQLLSGEVPFNGETLPQVCVNVATRPAPPLRKVRPDVPAGLEMIVLRCLEKDLSKRFASVSALSTALARFGSRRAQASLERIVRITQSAEEQREDARGSRRDRSTDRPVTGPLPTWGGTAKSRNARSRSLASWVAGSLIVGSAGFTFAVLQSWARPTEAPAVLITPSRVTETGDGIVARGATPGHVPPASSSASAPELAASGGADPSAERAPAIEKVAGGSYAPLEPPRVSSPSSPGPAAPSASPALSDTETNPYGATPAAPPPAAGSQMCVLNLNSLPPARVLLDGKPLGFTPKIGVVATPGEHRVVFHWDDRDKHTTVTCTRGEAKTVAVRLSDTPPEDERFERNPYR